MIKSTARYWRVINIVIFGLALITPWLRLEFDAYSPPLPFMPGWSFVLEFWRGLWSDLLARGLDLDMWLFWLLGFGYVLVLAYIILSIYFVAKDVRLRRNKTLSFLLLGTTGLFLFPVLMGAQARLGYWLINLALLSSALLEWMKADSLD